MRSLRARVTRTCFAQTAERSSSVCKVWGRIVAAQRSNVALSGTRWN
jgi:hypothetical protein